MTSSVNQKIKRKCVRCQIRKDLITLLKSLLEDKRINLGLDIQEKFKERLKKLREK